MRSKIANKPPKCFANFHLTPEEYGLWNYLRSVSFESGIAYLSGRQIAQHFDDTDKNAIYRLIDRLFAKAWLEEFSPFHTTSTGQYVPRSAIVLDHEAWVRAHGTASCRPVPESGQALPVPISDLSRNTDTPVLKSGRSCPKIGTNIDVDLDVDPEKVVVERNAANPPSLSQIQADKESLLSDMRAIYDHHRVPDWNTAPTDEARALMLAAQHGRTAFLHAFDSWCYHDAYGQIETKHGDTLKLPVRKFFGQIEHYKKVAQEDANRRAKPDACPIVREKKAA